MVRPLRLSFENALYHITSRGNESRIIFENEHDWDFFISIFFRSNPFLITFNLFKIEINGNILLIYNFKNMLMSK